MKHGPQAHDPSLPHPFIPRRHGTAFACKVCGGLSGDPLHQSGERAGEPPPWERWQHSREKKKRRR